MKKITLTTLCLLMTLALVPVLDASGQQNTGTEKSKGSTSLQSSLDELGQRLKESVPVDFSIVGARRRYVRLKQRVGCNISFQVSIVPSSPNANQPDRPATDLSLAEWKVNLSDLDLAKVEIGIPANGDYRVVHFATIGGKESIKWTGFGAGDVRWTSQGRIDVDEKNGSQIAEALKQAISACRK